MNILTFDIEEWYIEKHFKGGNIDHYKAYDSMLSRILDLLDQNNTKATFFCLGALVEDFPYVVKKISEKGHEIGCHSDTHRWVNKLTPKEFLDDTIKAVNSLQDVTGKKVRSFRAPAFSIDKSNKWAFEVLAECGIKNDASVFPSVRDFGGYPNFKGGNHPCRIVYNGIEINEFPISMTRLPFLGKEIAYSGGGYFRLLPLSFVMSRIESSDYVMCYFHIADLLNFKSKFKTREEYERYFKEDGSFKNRVTRYMKSNLGRKRAFHGLSEIVTNFEFQSMQEASMLSLPIVHL